MYEFLAGVHPSFEEVRGHILRQEPLPSIPEAFSILRNDEVRKASMTKKEPVAKIDPLVVTKASALAARSSDKGKNRPTCDHCKKEGHTKDKCWDLHGKPHD